MRPLAGRSSVATLAALVPHYLAFYLLAAPLWTGVIGEWIMARTPPAWALWLLANLGPWAKPFAATGGLATLGFCVMLLAAVRRAWLAAGAALLLALLAGWIFEYRSATGQLTFWVPALLMTRRPPARARVERPGSTRREALAMVGGVAAVAAESLVRERRAAAMAETPRQLAAFQSPREEFAPGLVRPAVTPTGTFYVMSKNTVDPAIAARNWRLKITSAGKSRLWRYEEILELPRVSEYVTLRCISNTLQSDLMGTALWTGVRLHHLIDPQALDGRAVEAAAIGVDGHGDSFSPSYLLSGDAMLATGMNGMTLSRTHGFPVRLIVPRYYGFKSVKWLAEIAFVREPYFGTWPKMGYTKEPVIHTVCHVDRMQREPDRLLVGGVAFAGDRGVKAVQVRASGGPWTSAETEQPLSRFTWTRWYAAIDAGAAKEVEARAMDGGGRWQETVESPLFPDGVKGPTIRRIT
jgi:DMSO/TMAO reductase YedYZ molybdopterin-dependent catalytic subunit